MTPKASSNRLAGVQIRPDGQVFLKVFVTVAPEQGKANEAVIRLLAQTWKLAKSQISLTAGATASFKTFRLAPLSPLEKERLVAWEKALG